MPVMLKTDTSDTGDFQKHGKTDEIKSIWDLGKYYYFMKMMFCLCNWKQHKEEW